jgi:hypothetical protein
MKAGYEPGISFASRDWFIKKGIEVVSYGFLSPTLCFREAFKSGSDCCRYLDKFESDKNPKNKVTQRYQKTVLDFPEKTDRGEAKYVLVDFLRTFFASHDFPCWWGLHLDELGLHANVMIGTRPWDFAVGDFGNKRRDFWQNPQLLQKLNLEWKKRLDLVEDFRIKFDLQSSKALTRRRKRKVRRHFNMASRKTAGEISMTRR